MSNPAPQSDGLTAQAAVFTALGDPLRLGLVGRLADGQARSLVSLSAGAGMTRQAVAKHLLVLEQAGVVARARVGRESRFALRPEAVDAARAHLDHISAQWDAALGRLRVFVEGRGG
jgi:DNA-binding transcriptional ArsR family regulator